MENYLGAKNGSGVYQKIINLIPPHDTYIEPFLGTGAILRRKAKSKRDIGVDLNQRCIDAFDCTAAELYRENALEFLESFDFSSAGQTVIYCDPPYLHETRTSRARYDYELTDKDHERLIKILKSVPAKVILSGYESDLYNHLLSDWWSKNYRTMTRGGVRTETVWCNFVPGEVHYHTYAGKNFTDRQRIKRKAERWAKNFAALPHNERQAVFAALFEHL